MVAAMQAVGARQECFVYYGDKGEWLVAIAVTRDSEALDRSNFRVLERDLKGRFGDSVDVERHSHWACGWLDKLIVNPEDVAAVQAAQEWRERLDDYPIANEEDFSALEDEELHDLMDEITRWAEGYGHTLDWRPADNGDGYGCTCTTCGLQGDTHNYGGALTDGECGENG